MSRRDRIAALLLLALLSEPRTATALDRLRILSTLEINDATPNGPGCVDGDRYGRGLANMGDIDGDGVVDLAVGAPTTSARGPAQGAVHLHFLNSDGSIDRSVRLDGLAPNGAALSDGDHYGGAVANVGDLDGDGLPELAVGAGYDDSVWENAGAVYLHYLNADGSIAATAKLDASTPNGAALAKNDHYGSSIAGLGDVDFDGVPDIIVGSTLGDHGRGISYVHLMNPDGSIRFTRRIGFGSAFGPELSPGDRFGASLANIGDLDGDGIPEIAVGAPGDAGAGRLRGALHLHFIGWAAVVAWTEEINDATPQGPLQKDGDGFGVSVASVGDLDRDGVRELAVGSILDDTGGLDRGALYLHTLTPAGQIVRTQKLTSRTRNGPSVADGERYGRAVVGLGDLDGNGVGDLAVGQYFDSGAGGTGSQVGAVQLHFMGTAPARAGSPASAAGLVGVLLASGLFSLGRRSWRGRRPCRAVRSR